MTVIIDGTNGITDVDGSAATPALTGTDTDTGMWFPAVNTVAWSTGGSERMRIDSSGNVGIGTSSPSTPIDVVGNSSGIGTRIRGRTSDNYGVLEFTNNGASAETARLSADTSGNIVFSNTGSVTERMRIDSSGNVGIGTASPSDKLTVISAGTQVGSTNFRNIARIGLATNDASVLLGYDISAGSAIMASTNNYPIAFWTSIAGTYAEKMRITSAGDVGIGEAASIVRKLCITASGTTATTRACIQLKNEVGTTAEIYQGPTSNNALIFEENGSERMRIDASGNVLVTSVAGLGYGTGAGGTVTQTTSRTTGVTLSKPTGAITMFSAAGSTTAATFTVTNTLVAATDIIILNQKSGTNLYDLLVTAVTAGSFNITFRTTSGTATDAPVINFALIKGVTA